jgi:hypothetical protein
VSDAILAPAERTSEAEAEMLAREFAAAFGKMFRR